ncbi:InlB B-repeat-containing protein, partial [Ruminococcaceae bacterium OttesenSCG-928-L11]|nr:InlB B-repeat-containing protein [Ruminococcaceae bacterium OttesenSCG-928-L11]
MSKFYNTIGKRIVAWSLTVFMLIPNGVDTLLLAAAASGGTVDLLVKTSEILDTIESHLGSEAVEQLQSAAAEEGSVLTPVDAGSYVEADTAAVDVYSVPDKVILDEGGSVVDTVKDTDAAIDESVVVEADFAEIFNSDLEIAVDGEDDLTSAVLKKELLEALNGKWFVKSFDSDYLQMENSVAIVALDPTTFELVVYFVNNTDQNVNFNLRVVDNEGVTVDIHEVTSMIQKARKQTLQAEDLARYKNDPAVEIISITAVQSEEIAEQPEETEAPSQPEEATSPIEEGTQEETSASEEETSATEESTQEETSVPEEPTSEEETSATEETTQEETSAPEEPASEEATDATEESTQEETSSEVEEATQEDAAEETSEEETDASEEETSFYLAFGNKSLTVVSVGETPEIEPSEEETVEETSESVEETEESTSAENENGTDAPSEPTGEEETDATEPSSESNGSAPEAPAETPEVKIVVEETEGDALFVESETGKASVKGNGSATIASKARSLTSAVVTIANFAAPLATEFTVTFYPDADDKETFSTGTIVDGIVSVPEDPAAPEGYAFIGWFEEGSDTEFDFATAITRSYELYARYTPAYTVSFYVNDQLWAAETVATGNICPRPLGQPDLPDGTVAFIGWFASNSNTAFDFENTPVNRNIVLEARFTETYLVKYKSAPGGEDLVIDSVELYAEQGVPHTSATVYPPENSYLEYWYVEQDFDPNVSDVPEPFLGFGRPTDRDITLVPHFNNQYYVFFISQGTQVPFLTVLGGDVASTPAEPTREGYKFAYWSTDLEGNDRFDFSTIITQNTTLYANWTAKSVNYTVAIWMEKPNLSADPDYEPTIGNNSEYNYVESVTLTGLAGTPTNLAAGTLPTNISSLFTNGSHDLLKYGQFQGVVNKEILGNGTTVVNLYATRKVYKITFSLGSNSNNWMKVGTTTYYGNSNTRYSIRAKYEQDISALFPARPTVTFSDRNSSNKHVGWTPDSSMSDTVNWVSLRPTMESSVLASNGQKLEYTVTARWSSASPYYVRYWAEVIPGTSGGIRITVPNNNNYSASIKGKTFELLTSLSQELTSSGSVSAKDLNGLTKLNSGSAVAVYEKGTTYQFSSGSNYTKTTSFFYSRKSFTLSFNTMAGSDTVQNKPGNQTLKYQESLAGYRPSPDPSRTGYTFAGWYRDADYKQEFDFANTIMPIGGMTAYAKWTSTANKVTFYGDMTKDEYLGETGRETNGYLTESDSLYSVGEVVPGKGQFDGWYIFITPTNAIRFSFETPITGDIELHASWKTSGFTVTYDIGDGIGSAPVDGDSYYVGKQTRLADDSSFEAPNGQVFLGWVVDGEDSGNFYYPGTVYAVNGDTTFVAAFGNTGDFVRVSYHSNYPNGTNKTIRWYVRKNTTITLADAIFSYPNSSLLGWSKSSGSDNSADYALSSSYDVKTTEVNLYGVWQFSGYTITFEPGSHGALKSTDTSVFRGIEAGAVWGDTITVPTVIPNPNYRFVSWDPVLPDNSSKIWESQTYVATYAPKSRLEFKAGDASVPYNNSWQVVTVGVALLNPEDLIDGHRFISASGSGEGKYAGNYNTNVIANSVKIVDDTDTPIKISDYYNVTYKTGNLEITTGENVLTLIANSKTDLIYDGTEQTVSGYTPNGLLSGHRIVSTNISASQSATNANEYDVEIQVDGNVVIWDEDDQDVS